MRSAAAYDAALVAQMKKGITLSQGELAALNEILQTVSQELIYSKGLPKRPWYRNMIYAPGYYTGYGVKTLPGVREAIEQRQWDLAAEQMIITAKIIHQYANHIEKATTLME